MSAEPSGWDILLPPWVWAAFPAQGNVSTVPLEVIPGMEDVVSAFPAQCVCRGKVKVLAGQVCVSRMA